jgi:PPM family protein phosphatase
VSVAVEVARMTTTKGWAITDVGSKRDHNEDSFLCNDGLSLYAVADGMGGHLGGERASRMAVEILEEEVRRRLDQGLREELQARPKNDGTPHPAALALREATLRAAHAIHTEAQADAEHAGMGTTLTGALFHGEHLTLCHVGDSRAYLHRDGQARQLTEDHSWIQEQIKAGLITHDDALVSRFRNIITRSVGFEPSVEPDLITVAVEPGDCLLLCTDGLSNYLSPEELAAVLTGHFYADVGRAFVDLANARGGDDNITCVVIYVPNTAPRVDSAGAAT